jgi:hypothetical protein
MKFEIKHPMTPFDKAKEEAAVEYAVNRWRHKTAEAYIEEGISKEGFKVGVMWAERQLNADIAKLQKALAVARGALELFCDDACKPANINGVFCSDETLDAANKALAEIKEIVGEK